MYERVRKAFKLIRIKEFLQKIIKVWIFSEIKNLDTPHNFAKNSNFDDFSNLKFYLVRLCVRFKNIKKKKISKHE